MIGRGLPTESILDGYPTKEDRGSFTLLKSLLKYPDKQLPAIALEPKDWNKRIVIWVDPQGKQSLFTEDGKPRPGVQKILDAGTMVLSADLFGQGEFTLDGKPIAKAPLVDGHIEFTFGYNPPKFSERVRDVLTLVAFAHSKAFGTQRVDMIGLNGAGPWVAAARAIAGDKIDRAAIDTGGFRFANITTFDNPDFLPGGAKYNDLPGMIALSAPNPLWLAGEGAGCRQLSPPPTKRLASRTKPPFFPATRPSARMPPSSGC